MLTGEAVEVELHSRAYAALLSDFYSCHAVEGMSQVEVGVAQLAGVNGHGIVGRPVYTVYVFAAHHNLTQMLCAT